MQVTACMYVPPRAMPMLQYIGCGCAKCLPGRYRYMRLGSGPIMRTAQHVECNFSRRAHIDEANVQLLKKRSTSSPLFFLRHFAFLLVSSGGLIIPLTTWKYKEYTLVLYRLVASNGLCPAIQQHHHARIRHRYFCPRLDLKCLQASKKKIHNLQQAPPRPRLKLPRPACHHRL